MLIPILYPLSAKNAEYVDRVRVVLDDPGAAEAIAPWLTEACTECEQVPSPGDRDHVVVVTPIGRYVAIGCDFYWIISPVAFGLETAQTSTWCDWLDDIPDLESCDADPCTRTSRHPLAGLTADEKERHAKPPPGRGAPVGGDH